MPDRNLVTFDLLTAMAFLAFREAQADVQVLETGLGGRVDSTNAVEQKEVCVITSVSLEHQAILGDTLPQIAAEKAGIIAPGATVVLATQAEPVAEVIRRACDDRDADLVEASRLCRFERRCRGVEGQEVRLSTPGPSTTSGCRCSGFTRWRTPSRPCWRSRRCGTHGVAASTEQVRDGLAKVRWPGRLEVLSRRPLLLADGAHNAESARRLRETLSDDLGFAKATFVIGVSRDKDTAGMERELRPMASGSSPPARAIRGRWRRNAWRRHSP